MPEAEDLSMLLEHVYDCAIDPDRWPEVLAELSRFAGGCAAGIFVKNAAARSAGFHYVEAGLTDAAAASYLATYAKIDPMTVLQFFTGVGELASTIDLLPYDEFQKTRFYQEWARPLKFADNLSAVLDKGPTTVSLFGIHRNDSQGLVDEEMRRRMRLIVPHVRRAVLIGGMLEHQALKADAVAEALDSVAAAMFLLSATGTVVHANAAGLQLLRQADLLRIAGDRLASVNGSVDRLLLETSADPSDDMGVSTRGIAEPAIGSGGQRYLVHSLSLRGGQRRRLAGSFAASTLLFVQRTELTGPAAPEAMARAYALTPGELRVLLAISDVGGVPEVAQTLDIAESTVRFHLRALFEKTGVRRQADLVKIVAGYSAGVIG